MLEEILILEVCGGYGGGGGGRASPLGRGWMLPLLGSSPLYIGAGGRFREPTELMDEYAHRTFTNVVPFDETELTEPSTGGVCPYRWSLNLQMLSYFARHFFIRTPIRVFFGSLNSYGRGIQHHSRRSVSYTHLTLPTNREV